VIELQTSKAEIGGQAGRISAADKAASQLLAPGGALTGQVTVTRAATGKQETYTVTIPVDQLKGAE
jgi:hypothetical protein